MQALVTLAMVLLPVAAPPAEAPGITLASGGVAVELLPAPEGISFSFYDGSGAPIPNERIRARALVAVFAGERQEVPLVRSEASPYGFSSSLDLARAEAFSLVLLFEHEGRPHVLRFPRLSPYPPYVTEEASHEELEHAHVTPHDGFVVVVGENHAELVVTEDRLRLFWYDVSMNQIPAAELEASCFLEPCAGRVERVPLVPQGARADYLEATTPRSCASASRVALRLASGEESRTYRFRLREPLAALGRLARPLLDSVTTDGHLLELRGGSSDFPGPCELELRVMEARSLAPVVLRQAPRALLLPRGGGSLELPAPLRLQADGRWRLRGWLPPGARSLAVQFVGRDGVERQALFAWQGPGGWRPVDLVWLALTLAAGLLLLVGCTRRSKPGRGRDLVRLLGLEPTLRSRLFPAFIQWPLLLLFGLVLYRVFQGPERSVENPAVGLLLGLLLPAVLLSALLLSRLWCAVCPFTLVIDTVRELAGRDGPKPRLLVKHRWSLVSVQLLALPLVMLTAGWLAQSSLIGLVLAGYLVVAAAMAWLYERRAFCSSVCPLGSLLGLCAAAAPHRLEQESCTEGCVPDCDLDTGTDDTVSAPAAPAASRVVSSCACASCLEGCRHQAVSIRTRPLFEGLRQSAAGVGRLAGPLPAVLLALALLLSVSLHPLWLSARVTALAVTLLPVALVWLAARAGVSGEAVVPLAVASIAAWALTLLSGGLAGLAPSLSATLRGERLDPLAAPGLTPAVLTALVIGIIVVGTLLSTLMLWRCQSSPGARLAQLTAVVLSAAMLLALAATSFHLRLPAGLVS